MKRCFNCGHDTAEHHHDRDVRRGRSGLYAREYRCLECGAGGNEVVYRGEILTVNGPARDSNWNERCAGVDQARVIADTATNSDWGIKTA